MDKSNQADRSAPKRPKRIRTNPVRRIVRPVQALEDNRSDHDDDDGDGMIGQAVRQGDDAALFFDLGDELLEEVERDGEGDPIATGRSSAGRTTLHPDRDDTNTRLDKFVAQRLPDLSRSYIQQLIEKGHVQVDSVVHRSAFKMTPGEVVTVDVPAPVVDTIQPEAMDLAIVFENDDVIVIDKPAGLVVHPAPGHSSGTLVNGLLHYAPEINVSGTLRPGIVHRLDKDTSGLIVVAKTDRARNSLVAQWESRSVEKRYIALAEGVFADDEVTVDAPIGRDPMQRQRMAVIPSGRNAISHIQVKERLPDANATLVDVTIETGRTHQIRVHLAFIKHPVIGDEVYGKIRPNGKRTDPRLRRQFLHAAGLAFSLPEGERMSFEAPLPSDLTSALERIRATKPR